MRNLFICLMLFVLASCAAPPAARVPPAAADPQAALLAGLRQGGYIIYLRHAETRATPEPSVGDLADCSWQRNLNDDGFAQAAALNAQVRELGIAVSALEASPFCRTRQTADLVFGQQARINPDLYYHVTQTPAEVAVADATLRARLGKLPPRGGNLVLVGHAPTMRDAAGVELPEGQAAIVKPNGDGTFRVVGRLGVGGVSAVGQT